MTTLNFLRTSPLATLLAALALTACELPAKVGDLPDTETAAESGAETGETGDATEGGTIDEPNPTAPDTTTSATSDSGDDPSDSSPATDPSAGPPECADFDEAQCTSDPGCAPLYGEPLIVEGCMIGSAVFLLCHDADLECDTAESFVCDEQSAYKIPVTCEFPGLDECGPPMCGAPCEGLSESDCTADDACKPVYGNPHVPFDDGLCVDGNTTAYLGCLQDTGECPPFIPTVCPEGVADEFYDVPSGCVPPHFEECGQGGTPACP